jgi:hypothetical protein
MQKIIQIHPCLLKLSHKQESMTDGQTDSRYYYIPHRYRGGIISISNKFLHIEEQLNSYPKVFKISYTFMDFYFSPHLIKRGHPFYEVTFSLQNGWPIREGLLYYI